MGKYGATKQSWSEENPRHLLKEIMDANTGLSEESAIDLMSTRLLQEHRVGYLKTAIAYWVTNNYYALKREMAPTAKVLPFVKLAQPTAMQKKQASQKLHETIKAKIVAHAPTLMLDYLLPNGKRLRDCTFQEVKTIGQGLNKEGAWMLNIAAMGKPTAIVGEVLTEKDLPSK
jgi:hypothetical protein